MPNVLRERVRQQAGLLSLSGMPMQWVADAGCANLHPSVALS
jgi:hypothetical protein